MKNLLLFSIFLLALNLQAQNEIESTLPRFATPEELQIMKDHKPFVSLRGITDPPPFPVRAMAEWEELQALVITWRGYSAILTEIVRAAREETMVIVCCSSQSTLTSAQTALQNAGVDLRSNVHLMVANNNTVWVRDYGMNCIYGNDVDTLLLVDWIYNRPRPQDDALPEILAQHLNLPIYSTTLAPNDLVHTGGNFMVDGLGTAFSSELVLEENGPQSNFGTSDHNEQEIDDIMADFMGITRYPKMTVLPYDAIHHIDMHMKLLDEETILMGEYPTGVADGPQIEANLQYILSNYNSAFGTPYKVIRMPMPPEASGQFPHQGGDYRTYTNAVFVNKKVLLPTYQERYDTTAIRIWQESMPGYTIVPINCNAIIPASGAIHCITKEIGVNDPLMIVHQPLRDVTDNNVAGYPVIGKLKHRSGINEATLYWTTDPNGVWENIVLESLNVSPDSFGAVIPVQIPGTTVYYFIEGKSQSGKHQVRPITAPEGFWKFKILESSFVGEIAETTFAEIFPNPATAITCIPLNCNQKTSGSLNLIDAFGRQIETLHSGVFPAGESKYFLDARKYPSGFYFVEWLVGGSRETKKLVIK